MAPLVTVMPLPLKSIFSLYVPGATRTVSPLRAALIPAWIVGWSAGTRIVICASSGLTPRKQSSVARRPQEQSHHAKRGHLGRHSLTFFRIKPVSTLDLCCATGRFSWLATRWYEYEFDSCQVRVVIDMDLSTVLFQTRQLCSISVFSILNAAPGEQPVVTWRQISCYEGPIGVGSDNGHVVVFLGFEDYR